MPHRHPIKPNPYLLICPLDTIPERFGTHAKPFPKHLTFLTSFTIPDGAVDQFASQVADFGQAQAPFEVTFREPEEWIGHDGEVYRVQCVDEGRENMVEVHQGLRRIVVQLGGLMLDDRFSGERYNPHVNLEQDSKPYASGEIETVRSLLVIARFPKSYRPLDKILFSAHRMKGDVKGTIGA